MNYDEMYYRTWREEIRQRGYGGLSWRVASQFYQILGMFYLDDRRRA